MKLTRLNDTELIEKLKELEIQYNIQEWPLCDMQSGIEEILIELEMRRLDYE